MNSDVSTKVDRILNSLQSGDTVIVLVFDEDKHPIFEEAVHILAEKGYKVEHPYAEKWVVKKGES